MVGHTYELQGRGVREGNELGGGQIMAQIKATSWVDLGGKMGGKQGQSER